MRCLPVQRRITLANERVARGRGFDEAAVIDEVSDRNLRGDRLHRAEVIAVPVRGDQVIDVRDENITWHGRWVGAVRPKIPWATELLGDKATLESTNRVATQ